MTGLAPARAIAHAAGVVHFFGGPRRCTAMASVAIHARSALQLSFWNMVTWFRQSATVIPLRDVGATMARFASCRGSYRMVHGDGGVKTDL